jgi:hypothetical protein
VRGKSVEQGIGEPALAADPRNDGYLPAAPYLRERATDGRRYPRPGANPWYAAQQLGHVDVSVVFQTYAKFISSDDQPPRLQIVQPGWHRK